MNKYDYDGPSKFRPLSPWAYVGYSILFAIPIIGWIILIVLTFNSDNINRRCFARSYWVFALIFLIVAVVTLTAGGTAMMSAFAEEQSIMEQISSIFSGSFFANSKMPEETGSDPTNFKDWLDSYEAFIDEYIAFMNVYSDSDPDLGMLADYSALLLRYADMADKIDQIDEDTLSEDDLAYYIEVTTRVYTKLAAIE